MARGTCRKPMDLKLAVVAHGSPSSAVWKNCASISLYAVIVQNPNVGLSATK
jgi:hypothetical protein